MARFSRTLAAAVVTSFALTGLGSFFALDTEGSGGQHTQALAPGEALRPKTVEYTLVAQNTTLEIAPGVRVEAWTYNGTIPGPVLRATEGDRVILHFINET
ncbi:MAG TPA: multicopper oxidase domain-containing protein, partial [Nitrososphaera sp.]